MVEKDGWLQPAHYSNPDEEWSHLNESCGICDISPTGKLLLQGKNLGVFLADVLGLDGAPAVGEVRRLSLPASGRLARLAGDESLVLCPAPELPRWVAAVPGESPDCAHLLDRTSGLAGVRLTGPKAEQLLSKLTELDISTRSTGEAFPDLRCAQTRCAEIHGTLVRTDLEPLSSYDLYFPREFGEYMWDAVFEAGEEFGAGPVGFEAIDRLQS